MPYLLSLSFFFAEEIQRLKSETGCSETRIKDLHARFKELDRSNSDSLGRDDFLHIPEFVMNPLADRITHLFFQNPTGEKFMHGYTLEWCQGLYR